MRRNISHLDEVHMIGKLADLKEELYKNSLVIGALTELLIEKGLLNTEEVEERIARLDLYGTLEATSGKTSVANHSVHTNRIP
jgi:hypothetical protein